MARIRHVGINLHEVTKKRKPTTLVSVTMVLLIDAGRKGNSNAYPSVRPIRTPSLLRRLVDLDVLDDEIAGVEALGVGVRFGVLEQAEQELGGFDGPAGLGHAELLACGVL